MRLALPVARPLLCLALVLVALPTRDVCAETKRLYESEVVLPTDLYTCEGILLQAGRFKLELRVDQGRHALAFLRQEKVIATVLEQPAQGVRPVSGESEVPLFGTLHLSPIGPVDRNEPPKPGASDYFPKLPWRAVLRGYRSEDPANAVAKFVISERDESGKLTNRNFKLCLKKPG